MGNGSTKQNALRGWYENHKDKLVSGVSQTAKVSAAVASEAANVAMDTLLSSGKEAALRILQERMPNVGSAAPFIINAMESQLYAGVNAETYSQYAGKTGRGEPGFYGGVSEHAYLDVVNRLGGFTGGFDDADFAEGGCGCRGGFIGSDELDTTTVRDYANSRNSVAKGKIISEIVEIATKLGLKISGDTPQAKIKSLLEQIPSGDKFKQSPETHRKTCLAIAEAINRIHGNTIINKTMPADVICQQVAEVVSSLGAGMHTEFLAVYNDVRKVLKNLHILKDALKDDHKAIVERVKSSDDALLPDQLTTLNDLHGILTDEIDRQISMLQNLLNITLFPTEKDLAGLIKSKKDLHGYIEKIDVKVGSERFGKVISDILKGLGLTANFALLIERALKTVGITLDEYAKGSSTQKLREKITQNLMGKNLTEAQLHEYLEAADLLYRNFYRNQDIAKTLEVAHEKSGKFESMYTGSDEYLGGDDKYQRTVMDKRIADRKKLRGLIFNTFYKQLNDIFDRFVGSLDALSLKVGDEIPLSDQLDGLRHVMQRINESLVRNKNIYYALIGYYNDAMSKNKKDTLLGELKMVSSFIDTILELPMYKSSAQYFTAVQGNIKAMIDLIERFSDEIAAKFGRGEETDPTAKYEGAYDNPDAVFGGADLPSQLEEEPKIVYRPTKSIHDAIRQFDYKYRVAQIRQNMNRASKELSHYSEKYEKVIANSIADILESDKKKYERLRKELSDMERFKASAPAAAPNTHDLQGYEVADAEGFKKAEEIKAQHDAALKFLDSQWEAKKKFWATIEAADSYMRVFTDALVKNPNDIKEIKSMLDEIEVINDWYSDGTGNDLVGVFEHFPSFVRDNAVTSANVAAGTRNVLYPPDEYIAKDPTHYYARIAKNLGKPTGGVFLANDADVHMAALPGNPHLVAIPTRGEQARNQVRKTFTGLAVLKNLLSVFIHVGSKFGGEELRKKIFMSPSQMYNNLIEYLQASAFAQGFGVGEITNTDLTSPLPAAFWNSDSMAVEFDLDKGTVPHSSSHGATAAAARFLSADNRVYDPAHKVIHLGLTSKGDIDVDVAVGGTPASAVQAVQLFKKRWGVWMRSSNEALQSLEGFGFKNEDEYFVIMLKSIAAKIFTVTGMYDVLDRPMEFNGLSPIRMITGGAGETPKVEEGAVALYFRLPLLAQFYRGIFGFDSEDGYINKSEFRRRDTNVKISMVPDIDGTFAGLIRLIFRKTKYVNSNAYSDEDIKEIIRECNLIYQRMQAKYPQNTVMETIHELVAEVNRRYSIVSKDEVVDYEREFGYRYDYSRTGVGATDPVMDRYTEAPETEYAILPGEGEDEVVRPSAAQRLLGETLETSAEKKRMFTITKHHRDLVYKFRCSIDRYFENPDEEFTFNQAIKSTQLKLKKETRDEERFKIISSLIRGVDVYSKVDGMKYVLFHETVVGGLNVLSSIHTLLARFKRRAQLISLRDIQDKVWDYFADTSDDRKSLSVDLAGPAAPSLTTYIRRYLSDTLGLQEDNPQLVALVNKLFGNYEAAQSHGGHLDDPGVGAAVDVGKLYAIKATNGISSGADGAIAYVPRFHGDCTVRNFAVGVAPHASVKCKQTGDRVITLQPLAGVDLTNDVRPAVGAGGVQNSGLFTVLAGFGVTQLRKAFNDSKDKGSDAKLAAETFMRFIFGRDFVMKELLESLFGFGHDFQGLVEVKVEDGKLYLSYSGLKTLIEEMFSHVSYFLDLLRPHVKSDLITRYTDKLVPGSYYWLQEQLMEKIIMGRPPAPVTLPGESEKRIGYASLDELMQKLTYTYTELTRDYMVDGSNLTVSTGGPATAVKLTNTTSKNSFDKVFAEMIFYDAAKPASGLIKSTMANTANAAFPYEATNGVKIVDFLHNPYESLHFAGAPGSKILDTRYAARFYQLYSFKDEFTMNRSVLFAFNQLVAKYIQSFYDPVSAKVYAGILNQFANGAFNRSVADQLHTYPDTVPGFAVKLGGGIDVKVPNTLFVESAFRGAEGAVDVSALTQVVLNLLKHGTARNQPAHDRAEILKLTHDDVRGNTNLTVAGAPLAFPKIHIWLTIHAIALNINDIFSAFAATPAATAAGGAGGPTVAMMNLFATPFVTAATAAAGAAVVVPPTLGAARQRCGSQSANVNPTLEEITNSLLDGGLANAVPRVEYAIVHAQNAAGTEIEWTAGSRYVQPILPAADSLGNRIRNAFNRWVLNSETMTPVADPATIINTSSRLFPLADDVTGRNEDELKYRAELYSAILMRASAAARVNRTAAAAAAAAPAGPRVDFNVEMLKSATEITNAIGSKSTYSPNPTGDLKVLIKYDDALNTVLDDRAFAEGAISRPLIDVNYIIAARSTALSGALPAGNMAKLGQIGTGPHDSACDDINAIQNFGKRMDPDADHVLFTSLSVIIKNLLNSRHIQNQSLIYIQDNIADVALYMKEKMRANLPAFRNLFKELMTRCEFLKKFMSRSEMNMTREWTCHGVGTGGAYKRNVVPSHNPWPYVLQRTTDSATAMTMSSVNTKNRWTGILDTIVRGCTSIMTSCDQVLREVGDDPKYFELYQNSIKDYKSQYGFDPLMPLSSTLAVVKNVTNENYLNFFPIHNLGEDEFKFMYGTRSLLQQPQAQPLMENTLGFAQIVEQFNLLIDTKLQADKSRADSFMKTFVKLLRYVYEAKHVKGLLSSYVLTEVGNVSPNLYDLDAASSTMLHISGMFTRDDMVLTDKAHGTLVDRVPVAPAVAPDHTIYDNTTPIMLTNRSDVSLVADGKNMIRTPKYPLPVYSISKTLADTIKLTESSFKDDKIKELVEYLTSSSKSRNSLEIQNIIDLNIVPINVHALMREIPLANLYNYAYTFDRLIIELYYGMKNENARQLISDLCSQDDPGSTGLDRVTSARDMLVALLLKPYMSVFKASNEDDAERGKRDDMNYYEKFVKPMLVGVANNGEFGRPKFLSDQVYNKVVFGEVYEDPIEYNEMGPAAAHVARVQVNKEQTVMLLSSILAKTLIDVSGNAAVGGPSKLTGLIPAAALAPAVNEMLGKYCTAVARFSLENPNIPMKDMSDRIVNKLLGIKTGSRDMHVLLNNAVGAGAPNQSSAETLALWTSIIAKLITPHVISMITSFNGRGNISEQAFADDIAFALTSLDAFHRMPVVGAANAPWLGLEMTPGVGPQTSPANHDQAAWVLRERYYDRGAGGVGGAPTLTYPTSANIAAPQTAIPGYTSAVPAGNYTIRDRSFKIRSRIVEEIVSRNISFPVSTIAPTAALAPVTPNGAHVLDIITNFLSQNDLGMSRSISSRPNPPTTLHWLDVSSAAIDEDAEDPFTGPGVGHQRKPRGDNENVLDSKQVHHADVTPIRDVLAVVGRLRFDTVFIRNLIFIVNLYRSVRMKLQRDLVYNKDVILKSAPITRPQLTEFYGNQVDHAREDYSRNPMYRRYEY
jgi:hypothetical protein